jgi:hypothetical protein
MTIFHLEKRKKFRYIIKFPSWWIEEFCYGCRRGLSKHYQGKSQSFTSLASVKSLEDLAKRATPHRKKMKSCKSYGGDLDGHKSRTTPKATISKKASRGSFWSSTGRRSSLLGNSRR